MAKDEAMTDREDDDELGTPAVGLGATGGPAAGHAGLPGGAHPASQPGGGHPGAGHAAQPTAQPGAGHTASQPDGEQALSQPGGGHAAGQPGGGQALGQPGGGHAAGQPSGTQPMAQPGGGHTAAQPSSTQPLSQPGGGHPAGQPSSSQPTSQPQAGPAGQPTAQPGTGYPAQPGGAGQPVPTSLISTKGILIAAAAIVAIVIAALAAFFVLRPNPLQQTAAQQSPTANPTPGAAPAAATSDGPLLRGTYRELVEVRSSAGTSTGDNIVTITSDCPRCDVTIAAQGPTSAYQWNGNGWQRQITGPICPADIMTLTPTTVVDGIVQELSTYYATCNGTVRSSTMTRTGD